MYTKGNRKREMSYGSHDLNNILSKISDTSTTEEIKVNRFQKKNSNNQIFQYGGTNKNPNSSYLNSNAYFTDSPSTMHPSNINNVRSNPDFKNSNNKALLEESK